MTITHQTTRAQGVGERLNPISCRIEKGPRENIEDVVRSFTLISSVPWVPPIPLLLCFDGAGGEKGGEIAGTLGALRASSSIASFLAGTADCSQLDSKVIINAMIRALDEANQSIIQHVQGWPMLRGMATTAVIAVIVDGVLSVAWAGDSRCYAFQHRALRQITRDHSEIEALIEAGLLDRERAAGHPMSHVITRYLGQENGFKADARQWRVDPGDILLLCTDGLTDAVSDEQIAESMAAYQNGRFPFTELPGHLVDRAIAQGTTDNVTALCCELQPDVRAESVLQTLTGTYPVELATIVQRTNREYEHDTATG